METKINFSNLVNQRYQTARADMREMNRLKAELDFNKQLQEELTHKKKIDEDQKKNSVDIENALGYNDLNEKLFLM